MNKALSVIEEQIAKYELLATQKTKKQNEYLEVVEQLREIVKKCNLHSVSGSLPSDEDILEKYIEYKNKLTQPLTDYDDFRLQTAFENAAKWMRDLLRQ